MERDFLGLINSSKEGCIDHGFLGSAGMPWGLSNNRVSSLPQFMPFKPTPKEGPIKVSSSVFHSYGTTQKAFNLDRESAHFVQMRPGCPIHTNSLNDMRTFPVNNNSTDPFIKINGGVTGTNSAPTSVKQQKQLKEKHLLGGIPVTHEAVSMMGSFAGTYAPRSISKTTPVSSQLTIFYGGVVNVFDEVPVEKAQAVLFLAGNESSMTSNTANPRTPKVEGINPKPVVGDGVHVNQSLATSLSSTLSSSTSVRSHMGAQSRSGSTNADELMGAKALEACQPLKAISSLENVNETQVLSAFPQARKASLARFFEKRKERMRNSSPYPINSPHVCLGLDCVSKASTASFS